MHGQEQSQEQVDQNGVFSLFSPSLTMAGPNLLLAAPSMPVYTLAEPATEAKHLQPCMPTSRSQHDKALCSLFTHVHGMRTDGRRLKSAKVHGRWIR